MVGFILLFIALVTYFNRNTRWISLFLYISFMTGYLGGFGLWNDIVIGVKNQDLALVYTAVINACIIGDFKWNRLHSIYRKSYICIVAFLLFSCLFSLVYYDLSILQIVRGGRRFLLILSLPILLNTTRGELKIILKLLFCICICEAILFILQIPLSRPLMPYATSFSIDDSTGLPRFYNGPPYLVFFLTLTFIRPSLFPKSVNINYIRLILFVAEALKLGRTSLFVCILTVLLALMLNGKFKKTASSLIILGIFIIPFLGTLSQRFEKGNTSNDLEQIMKGDFGDDYQRQDDATMLFRLAIFYERADYLIDRPFAERVFGMGLASDSDPWVLNHYHFGIGLINEETGQVNQLANPDIAYANLITYLGYVGTIIYLWFCVSLARFYFHFRNENAFYLVLAAQMIMMFVGSLSGVGLSNPSTFSLYFLFLSMMRHKLFKNNSIRMKEQ